MGGGVPANTTTTTTVNQSPWQNPTYQALMLGNTKNPGPLTNILRSDQGYMTAYNNMLKQGLTPADIVNSNKYNPTAGVPGTSFRDAVSPPQTAAGGGIMNVRGYAPGGNVRTLTAAQVAAVKKYNNLVAQGKDVPEALITKINNIENRTGRNVSPFVDTGSAAVGNKSLQNSIATAAASGNYPKDVTGSSPYDTVASAYPESSAVTTYTDTQKKNADKAKEDSARQGILEQSMGQTAFMQAVPVIDPATGKPKLDASGKPITELQSTNPLFNQAVNRVLDAQQLPEQFGQATTAYNKGIAGLGEAAKYSPKDITAAQMSPYEKVTAAQMSPFERVASRDVTGASLGTIADITAPTARAESYQASQMGAPQEISAKGYDAAQMNAATMQGAQDIAANKLQQYQMDRDRIRNLQAQRSNVSEMTGPETWTSKGVAEKYMNPYVKTALASQQELANIDLKNQLNQIAGQAAGAGAFGGSKTQLALASARRNRDLANRNMAAQALSQAYTQGMGQFTGEQQMSQAAKQANQAATNAANLDYVARQYAAEAANQGMDYNTALQNMQAKLGVQQAQQQADLAASQANQMYGYGGFQSQSQNLAALNNAAQQNMQAINQQRSQYVTQALQAAQANQQAQLTTEQQNMIARNAASQFNALNATQISQANAQMSLAAQQSNQQTAYNTAAQNAQLAQQANLANQQQALQAALANQQAGLTTEQQNAQLAQQAALANQQAGLTTEQQNAQLAQQMALANQQTGLQAAIQNQQAGLTGQGLNLQALNQAGQMGQGLGSLGTTTWNLQQNLPQLWGAAGQTVQGIAQQAATGAQQTAQNYWGGMANTYQPTTSLILGAAGQQGTKQVNQTPGT